MHVLHFYFYDSFYKFILFCSFLLSRAVMARFVLLVVGTKSNIIDKLYV